MRTEKQSQPLLCGKVQNHAASTDAGQRGPGLVLPRL
jgi:hypothetical protein